MNNLILTNNNKQSSPPPHNHKAAYKINLKELKNNTYKSLIEVECFLNDFKRFTNYIKLYKILK